MHDDGWILVNQDHHKDLENQGYCFEIKQSFDLGEFAFSFIVTLIGLTLILSILACL